MNSIYQADLVLLIDGIQTDCFYYSWDLKKIFVKDSIYHEIFTPIMKNCNKLIGRIKSSKDVINDIELKDEIFLHLSFYSNILNFCSCINVLHCNISDRNGYLQTQIQMVELLFTGGLYNDENN